MLNEDGLHAFSVERCLLSALTRFILRFSEQHLHLNPKPRDAACSASHPDEVYQSTGALNQKK
jgi:hypothetical protein